MKHVGLGLLGPTLDAGAGARRWERWRPTISLFQHPDLLFSRFHLLTSPQFSGMAETVVADIARLSPETEVIVEDFAAPDAWDFETVYAGLFDLARLDRFDPEEEDLLVHITTGTHVAQICLFLLTEARYFPGRLIQTAPPRRGSAPRYEIIDLDLSRYDQIAQRFSVQHAEGAAMLKEGIETRNPAFNQMVDQIGRVSVASTAPILLQGPTGAGKTRLARRIYDVKRARKQLSGDFVEINCATIKGDGAMSALFGHRRGAFTGALQDREGLLRRADKGLLFLDEVGELGSDEQAMLLRAVETGTFLPVGSDREVRSDFQIICGTNRTLRTAVAAGAFREDLLARIDLWTFTLPGLADRTEDIAPNLDFELSQLATRLDRQVRFSREARGRFLTFATSSEALWTGNFRELNAAVVRMGTLARGGRITVSEVEEETQRLRRAWERPAAVTGLEGLDLPPLDRFEEVQLAEVVRVCRTARSLSDAGRKLFAVSRAQRKSKNDADRLRKYLARYDLSFDQLGSISRAASS